jgi:hypothetical protein
MDRIPPPRRATARHATLLLTCGGLLGASDVARADAVTDWNATADATLGGPPPARNRQYAMVQIAVHDALNAITPRYESYGAVPPAHPGASPGAAIAAAAHRVLSVTTPAQAANLLLVYNAGLAALPPCPGANPGCVQQGVDAGLAAANAILAQRTGDGSATPHLPYVLAAAPGVYEPTPNPTPDVLAVPAFAGWANVTPFGLVSGAQFRLGPDEVLDLGSEAYTRDYEEVRRTGANNAEAMGQRSAAQSANVRFWPPASWNGVARGLVAGMGMDEWEHARLFALLNIAQSDAAVAVMDSKYTYNFWRPVTAIRALDDTNPATVQDGAWLPYLTTPPYPDYPCGLTTNTGAASEVLERFFGTGDLPFTLTAGGETLSFTGMDHARAASVDARVHAGIHFRTGCRLGITLGRHVGRFEVQHLLRPLVPRKGGNTMKAHAPTTAPAKAALAPEATRSSRRAFTRPDSRRILRLR